MINIDQVSVTSVIVAIVLVCIENAAKVNYVSSTIVNCNLLHVHKLIPVLMEIFSAELLWRKGNFITTITGPVPSQSVQYKSR